MGGYVDGHYLPGVAALFFGKVVNQELQYKEEDDVYEQLADMVSDDPDTSWENEKEPESPNEEEVTFDLGIDIAVLQAENLNVKAWL